MTEHINPEAIYQKVLAERRINAAEAAAELVAKGIEKSRRDAITAKKLELQNDLVATIKQAGPYLANILQTEKRAPDASTYRVVQVPYRTEKSPRPLFGRRYEEGIRTELVPDTPVWLITSEIKSSSYSVDEARGGSHCAVPDWSEYVTYYKSIGSGICLDPNGSMFKYGWSSSTSEKDKGPVSPALLQVKLSTPENNDIVPLHVINNDLSNSLAILAKWEDNFERLVTGRRFEPTKL